MRRMRGSGWPARVPAAGLAVLGLAAACRQETAAPNGSSAAAGRLAGVWDATFVLTTLPLGVDTAAFRRSRTDRVRGVLAFVPNHWLATAAGEADGRPTAPAAYGSYDADFSPFGFEPREAGQVPAVVATVVRPSVVGQAAVRRTARDAAAGGDSVVLVLGPAGDRTRVHLAGAWHADSITGTWQLESAARGGASAAGRFVMAPRRPARRAETASRTP